MKKIIIITVLIAVFNSVSGQSGFIISPYFSYNQAISECPITTTSQHETVYADTVVQNFTYDYFKLKMGGGMRTGIVFEWNTPKNLHFFGSLNYYRSSKSTVKYSYFGEYSPYFIYNLKIDQTLIYYSKSCDLAMGLKYYISDNKIRPYITASLLFSYLDYRYDNEVFIQNNLPGYKPMERYNYFFKYKNNFNWGTQLGIGITLLRGDLLSLYSEAYCCLRNYSPQKSICYKKLYQGEDETYTLTTSEKEIQYVESYTDSDNEDESQASKDTKFRVPFSSAGLKIGLIIPIHKAKNKEIE